MHVYEYKLQFGHHMCMSAVCVCVHTYVSMNKRVIMLMHTVHILCVCVTVYCKNPVFSLAYNSSQFLVCK